MDLHVDQETAEALWEIAKDAEPMMMTAVHNGKMYCFQLGVRSIDLRRNDPRQYARIGHPHTVTLELMQLRPAQQIDNTPAPDTSVRDAVEANR